MWGGADIPIRHALIPDYKSSVIPSDAGFPRSGNPQVEGPAVYLPQSAYPFFKNTCVAPSPATVRTEVKPRSCKFIP